MATFPPRHHSPAAPDTPRPSTAAVPAGPAAPGARGPLRHFRVSDLRGLARLVTHAGLETARVAEELQSTWKPFLREVAGAATPPGTPDIPAKAVPPRADPRLDKAMHPYSGLRGFVRLSGQGVDAVLAGVESLLASTGRQPPETPERVAVLGALNGLAGRQLAATRNPLATGMVLLHRGEALRNHTLPPQAVVAGRVVLMVHGRGSTERIWNAPVHMRAQRRSNTPDRGMGEALAAALGATVLHLRYNSGLPATENGPALARALHALLARWPVPLTELAIVAHGQGGLVARHAVHFARQQPGWLWPQRVRHMVFLGTPHHAMAPENAIPLPEGIACHAIAGTLSGQAPSARSRWAGDGVVSVAEALGRHADPARSLVFAREAQHIAVRTHHLQLPHSAEVARKTIDWLSQPG